MKARNRAGANKMHLFLYISEVLFSEAIFPVIQYPGRVDSLNVRDDTEIDWKTLSDPDWNLWSAHTLQRRWLTMKRSIKGYENMSHAGKFVS